MMDSVISLDTTATAIAFEATDASIVAFGPNGAIHRPPITLVAERTETSAYGSVVDAGRAEFIAVFRRLAEIRHLPADWNGDEILLPNDMAMMNAQKLLNTLMDVSVLPAAIVPSAEGGVGFVFRRGALYADIECLNDGSVLAVTSDRQGQPTAWEVRPDYLGFQHAIGRISSHLWR